VVETPYGNHGEKVLVRGVWLGSKRRPAGILGSSGLFFGFNEPGLQVKVFGAYGEGQTAILGGHRPAERMSTGLIQGCPSCTQLHTVPSG